MLQGHLSCVTPQASASANGTKLSSGSVQTTNPQVCTRSSGPGRHVGPSPWERKTGGLWSSLTALPHLHLPKVPSLDPWQAVSTVSWSRVGDSLVTIHKMESTWHDQARTASERLTSSCLSAGNFVFHSPSWDSLFPKLAL